MATGNEFQNPGDRHDVKDAAGDKHAGNMQRETQERGLAANSYDSAKAGCVALCGEPHTWMSTSDKSFTEKTEALKQLSPEEIDGHMKLNTAKVESVSKYMASIEQRIKFVVNAQQTQEAMERANRTA